MEMLRTILDSEGHPDVVFEGEFFGPQRPDPNCGSAIRISDIQAGTSHWPFDQNIGTVFVPGAVRSLREIREMI